MRLFAAVLLVVVTSARADDDPANTFAILSLLGDRMTIVSHVVQTGTNFGSERHNVVKLTTPAFDHAALEAAESAVKAVVPDAKTVLLLARDPAVYDSQSEMIEADQPVTALLPRIRPLLEGTHAERLVLLTKVRYDAEVIIRTGNIAFGKLDGLGFYVDTNRPMANVKTGDTYRGFVAPYAYFRVSILDPAANRIVSEQVVHASTTLASHAGVGTWEEITPQEKMNGLQALLSQHVTRSVVLALRAAK